MDLTRPSLKYSWPVDDSGKISEEARELSERSIWLCPEYQKAQEEVLEFFCAETEDLDGAEEHRLKKEEARKQLEREETMILQPAQFAIAAEYRALIPLAETLRQRAASLYSNTLYVKMAVIVHFLTPSGHTEESNAESIGYAKKLITESAEELARIMCAGKVLSWIVSYRERGEAFSFIAGETFNGDSEDVFSLFIELMDSSAALMRETFANIPDAEEIAICCEAAGEYLAGYLADGVSDACAAISKNVLVDVSCGATLLSAGQLLKYVDRHSEEIENEVKKPEA